MSSQAPAKRRATQTADKPIKRTRVSRACDQCRLAREKCNGVQPTCLTCSSSKRACTYTANVKKRGIQPGYIRALELALAYLFQHNPENEILVNEKLAQGGSSSLLLSRDSKESNKLHKRWRKARFYNDVDKLLSGGEPPRHDQSEPLSPDSDEDDSGADEPPHAPLSSHRERSQALHQDVMSCPTSTAPSHQLSPTLTRVSMPTHSWKLFEHYFTNTHCWVPICEKHDLLKLSYSYPAEGLIVSSELSESGLHAELWSILAVAALQDPSYLRQQSQATEAVMEPKQLYATAKAFIPDEMGRFDLSHVKALLNLAICNISRDAMAAAWLLVATACRILDVTDGSVFAANSRLKHVVRACAVLDGLLALHLGKRPYFRKDEVRHLGRIDEDGLDEWQPWTGTTSKTMLQPRTPLLALSTFNATPDLLTLLTGDESVADSLRCLHQWESSVPPKLAHAYHTSRSGPFNPPAILLKAIYHCVSFRLTSTLSSMSRLLDLLENAQDHMGWEQLPPVLRCLLASIEKLNTGLVLSSAMQRRLHRLQDGAKTAWSKSGTQAQWPKSLSPAKDVLATNYIPTPLSGTQYRPTVGPSDDLLQSPPDSRIPEGSFSVLSPQSNVLHIVPPSEQLNSHCAEIPGDLESFFDELASLDTTDNLDNQPQFMQNLGFAPDANMADLFSDYIPLQSTSFLPQDNSDAINIDHYGFYDGS
ncbi:hypothetical protein FB567DRAFT_334055 [Paraphoma chrysanthemicola]|uniref:Zn(2)-C6 fungal-type domain-containing protein n=1 Tax=Paraphoma chrysanthemicola TaxID=798071 RepID=A0A8K0R5N8_9PLEO|nr:hypothetical protein FB567DRAFT_334055 [Paraphoma chrysanthemicola]